jgi:predicted dehydrogenase
MLRAVSIGRGLWSNELAAAIQGKSHRIRIVSCYSRSTEKLRKFAEAFGTGMHDSFEALLAEAGRAVEIAV